MGYRGKLIEKERARELRAQGMTMPDIAAALGVSRSSVSLWTRDVQFAPGPRRYNGQRRGPNALQLRKQAEIDRLLAEGRERIGELSEREFLVAGAALYAGEGGKRDGSLVFANSEPRMIAFFCAWIRRFCDVDESRLRVSLYLHRGLDLNAALNYWEAVTGIPRQQFLQPYRAVPDATIRHNKHAHGCPAVRYNCSATHRAVMGLVHGLLAWQPADRSGRLANPAPDRSAEDLETQ